MSRMLIVVGLFAFLGMAGLGALEQATGQEKAKGVAKAQVAPKVQTTQTLQPVRVHNCTIRLIDEAILGSGRTGILSEVPKEGDLVRKGRVVVRIKDDVAQANFNTAEKEAS